MPEQKSRFSPLLFAGILALTILGVLAFWMVEIVERLSMPHQEKASGSVGSP